MRDFKAFRWFSCILVVVVILCTGVASAYATAPTASDIVLASQNAPNENALLQFYAGGHILGFKPDRVYFASFDHAIVEEFVGTKGVMPVGEAGLEKQKKLKGAPALGKVMYKNVWQGITLKYEAKAGGIAESTYLLEPDADVKMVKLKYNVPVEIQKDGTLRYRHPSENGYFGLSAPKAWQYIESKRIPVEVAFADYGENTIGFRLGEYNRQYPLVIDPTFQWHTFYGSATGTDNASAITVDMSGNIYVTGYSTATWNGPAAQTPLNAHSGGQSNIVVLKLNTNGAYQWHTFYGSASSKGFNNGYGIAVDTIGNVYVTGMSPATWNGPGAAVPLNAHSGYVDIMVLKLNTSGAYQWHTFYGSPSSSYGDSYFGDSGNGIAVDTIGNIYVTGFSTATWNGPTAKAPLNAHGGGQTNIMVLKLNTNGAYQWHTFYGSASTGWNLGNGIAVDMSGNIYVTGDSAATWNGPAAQAPLNAHSGGGIDDIVILKLNTNGAYQWHTFYGSATGWNFGYGIAVDVSGGVYVTGNSWATWNGPATQAPLNAHSGGGIDDIVILKLNTNGAYQWHTFYGSASSEFAYGIAVDTSGNVYVTGFSTATWNGPAAQAPLNAHSGGGDAADIMVLELNTNGAYQWHTFYGSYSSSYGDSGSGIAVDTSGNVYAVGTSYGTWSGTGAVPPLNAFSGNYSITILKLTPPVTPCTYTLSPTSQTFSSTSGTGTVTVTASDSSCAWTATSSLSWVTITSGSSGTGNGTVTISVAANTTGATRTGTITIASQTFTITQSAATTDNCAATTSGPPGQIQMPFIQVFVFYYSGVLTYQPANTTGIWFALEQFTQVSTPGCTTPATLSNGTLTIPKLTLTTSSGAVVNASVILTSNDGVYYHLTGIY